MASPGPITPMNGWNQHGQTMPQAHVDESGFQVKPMGLKVHYTFDKESKINCLARHPHTLQVQTIPLDEKNAIGVVDLRVCLQAVTECSPELAGQEGDYTVYAVDYSELDMPLVGQGMLSWALETMNTDWSIQPKMVTGRVTKNVLAVFGGGNRETLEVKLKLTAAAKLQRPEPQLITDIQPMRPMEQAMTPTGASEWNSFLQSNPQLGHTAHVSRVASPALSQGAPPIMNRDRRDSFGPLYPGPSAQDVSRVAPTPVDPDAAPPQEKPRPSSRTSRRRAPTGRPRGRPRKKPMEGNTSGYEDGTEGEEGPVKKRAKTVKVDKAVSNPFGAGPESLRVAASTSGSLRNFRPVASGDNVVGSHLQEVPRAPTPVPEGGPMAQPPRAQKATKLRRGSTMSKELSASQANKLAQKPLRALSPSQEDGRSPDSGAPTPTYSEDEIGSSPPLARATPYMRSSPPNSSPVLPPMRQPNVPLDSSFMSLDVDPVFEDTLPQVAQDGRNPGSFQAKRPNEVVDSTGIPTQVFRLRAGPDGQEFVNILNYNTHLTPSSAAAPPSNVEAPSLPPLKQEPPTQPRRSRPAAKRTEKRTEKRSKQQPPPVMAPTPPPTTDAIEKVPSPAPEPTVEVTGETSESTEVAKEEILPEPTPTSEEEAILSLREALILPTAPSSPPKPRTNRHLSRSQSTSALTLPTTTTEDEPLGPSSLSQSFVAEPTRKATQIPSSLRRANSIGPTNLAVPASDPVGPAVPTLHLPTPAFSEAICPPSDMLPTPSSPPVKSNKNKVKKHSIKQRLETAILNGEMPPFCTNCGAINTPTWRKIFTQEHEGVPEYVEYSEKPGKITAIEILKRDEEDKPLAYRLVKKSLATDDDKNTWVEQLLCNPCGIWLTKYRNQRPPNFWDNAFGPLGQDRKRSAAAPTAPRPKKARTKSISQPNPPLMETNIRTDPRGPSPSSPKATDAPATQPNSRHGSEQAEDSQAPRERRGSGNSRQNNEVRSNPGSTHSRGSGTARSPIAIDLDLDVDLGTTKRLLFPSPRKDGQPKVLGEVSANIVQTTECRQNKELVVEKENVAVTSQDHAIDDHDDIEALFRSPLSARPSTPPPQAKGAPPSGPFKTPTRPTPNHRPITRSVSRSMRSVRAITSPSQHALLQRTPTKTPRGSQVVTGNTTLRRSPRHQQMNVAAVFDTPISRAICQAFSEPSLDLINSDFDLSSLSGLDTNNTTIYDFGSLLSTDPAGMPSSPPKDGLHGFDFSASADVWAQWNAESDVLIKEDRDREEREPSLD